MRLRIYDPDCPARRGLRLREEGEEVFLEVVNEEGWAIPQGHLLRLGEDGLCVIGNVSLDDGDDDWGLHLTKGDARVATQEEVRRGAAIPLRPNPDETPPRGETPRPPRRPPLPVPRPLFGPREEILSEEEFREAILEDHKADIIGAEMERAAREIGTLVRQPDHLDPQDARPWDLWEDKLEFEGLEEDDEDDEHEEEEYEEEEYEEYSEAEECPCDACRAEREGRDF